MISDFPKNFNDFKLQSKPLDTLAALLYMYLHGPHDGIIARTLLVNLSSCTRPGADLGLLKGGGVAMVKSEPSRGPGGFQHFESLF